MSEKWRTEKVKRPRADFEPHVAALELMVRRCGFEWEFGGSWRRGAQMIGDLDVIVQCSTFLPNLLEEGWTPRPAMKTSDDLVELTWQRQGDKIWQGDLRVGEVTVHVDFWAVRPAEWGAFLWFATGPKELNIEMRQLALRKGMNLSQIGLLREGVQLDNGTERDVALKLGFPWVEPTERQRWAEPRVTQLEQEVAGSKGARYKVRLESGSWTCTCPHFEYRNVICKHIRAVKAEQPTAIPKLTTADPFEGLL